MKHITWLSVGALLICVSVGGCARAARDTSEFAVNQNATVTASFETAWQATKDVLREMELDIYTRDKRGVFVAYTPQKRSMFIFTPHRTKYTITLESVSGTVTEVNVEAVKQVYGVTLLTYPDWHDRKTTDDTLAATILENVQARFTS